MNGNSITSGRVLIVESDATIAGMYADAISTHCPGVRIDVCRDGDCTLIEDNAGGADVAICGCGGATRLETLRKLTTARPCLRVLVLAPADLPALADSALAAGASDALLRTPGYLEQLPIAVRRNIRQARADVVKARRADEQTHALHELRAEVVSLRAQIAAIETPEPALPIVFVGAPAIGTRRYANAA